MTGSLRRRLVLSLCGSMVTAWLATAFFTYHDTSSLIDQVTDEHLQQSAEMMLGLVEHIPPDLIAKVLAAERRPEQRLSYRILIPEVPGGTHPPDGDWRSGFSNITDNGEDWRVYRTGDGAGIRVEVAVRQTVRESFAARIAAHILHPVWIAAPLLAVVIWLLVRWGLGPLERLTAGVRRRSPTDLSPLASRSAPTEVLPLVEALNALFARIKSARERDRRFAADAAHELRTPLAAIRAHAQVARSTDDIAECHAAVSEVLTGADRGTRIVEQLLALARIDDSTTGESAQPIDMVDLVRDTVARMAPQAVARNIDLALEVEADLVAVIRGNADLLAVMVRNLVDNALRYIPEGAQVTVQLSRRDDHLLLRVEDSGPGIPLELRERVKDRFFRVNGAAAPGSGLGLSIVVAIAEHHGGNLTLGARSGAPGLVAEVCLPLWQQTVEDVRA
ncbi:HAMP domain-containing protein [Ciceribacter ferrooxidans]|uniref:histidine kinase n=2 Tax=Ciceribacter ferrooxidans TaxID=2509717 RepID=A0A4Q2TJS3_9HYPH|nr:HAMP domain-containing protein [Ciceribacter ferrooxidans]